MVSRWLEAVLISSAGVIIWLFNFLRNRSSTAPPVGHPSSSSQQRGDFFDFVKQFATRGGLRSIFPGDDARDTSVQFELISQVNCTTSVGKPISVTVRNTPQDRRRMRMFGGF
jgi:hypothetical protein